MIKRWRIVLGIFAVAVLVLLADHFFLHVLFPLKKAGLLKELNARVETSLLENPTASNIQPPERPDWPNLPEGSGEESFVGEATKCLPKNRTNNPTELANQMRFKLKESRRLIENWHLTLPNGEQRRLMLIPSDRGGGGTGRNEEIRWFSVDAEGLPVPLQLDEKKTLNPTQDFLSSLLRQGEITFHQRREFNTYHDGTYSEIEWVGDRVREMQIRLPGKTLSCRNVECRCD